MELLDMILALREAKGKNAKVEMLKSFPEEHAVGLKVVVRYALDDMLSFRVSKIDDFVSSPLFDEPVLPSLPHHLITFLDYLNDKGGANNGDKQALAKIKAGLDDNDKQVADMVIARDLKCGMGLSSFRKVWGADFVPDMEYALMGGYDAKKITKLIKFDEGAFSQLKSDGKRCILTKRGTTYEGRSRNGKPIGYMPAICQAAAELEINPEVDFDLDGELVVLDENGKILPRTTGNGIVAKLSKGNITDDEMSRLRFVVWDLIIRTESDLKETYGIRFGRLKWLLQLSSNSPIMATESKTVWSLREAKEHYQEMLLRGEEGTVLKTNGSVWTPGDSISCRNANGFKFKEEFPAEFKCIGWYYGNKGTKYETAIGGLRFESSDGLVQFNVGSGLKDVQRFVEQPNDFIGTIWTIMYNARVMASDRTDIWSLFLPRAIEQRDDKTVADSLPKLIEQEEASRQLGMK
jgi:hypothetical protein